MFLFVVLVCVFGDLVIFIYFGLLRDGLGVCLWMFCLSLVWVWWLFCLGFDWLFGVLLVY